MSSHDQLHICSCGLHYNLNTQRMKRTRTALFHDDFGRITYLCLVTVSALSEFNQIKNSTCTLMINTPIHTFNIYYCLMLL